MLGFITNRLLNALNVTYAPYASCKALMSVTPDDDIKWLMYWVIHALIVGYESYVPVNPIPFWAEIKAALYFSLLFDGPITSNLVFNKVVRPYFLKYEKVLDKHLANLPEDAKKYMQGVKDSDAVKNVMTMTKEQADKLIAEHGPEVMEKMMSIARMQADGTLDKKIKETLGGMKKE